MKLEFLIKTLTNIANSCTNTNNDDGDDHYDKDNDDDINFNLALIFVISPFSCLISFYTNIFVVQIPRS